MRWLAWSLVRTRRRFRPKPFHCEGRPGSRRLSWLGLICLAFSMPAAVWAEEEPPLWRPATAGPVSEGRLEVDAQGQWRLTAPQGGESIPAQRAGRLQRAAPARVRPTAGLPLRIDLPGATAWPIGWIGWNSGQVRMEPWGGKNTTLPWTSLHSLRQPAGEVTVQFHTALGGAQPPSASVWSDPAAASRPPLAVDRPESRTGWRLPASSAGVLLKSASAARAGGVSLAVRISNDRSNGNKTPCAGTVAQDGDGLAGDSTTEPACTFEFLFGEQAPGEGLMVACHATGPRAIAGEPWQLSTAPPIEWGPGWHVLELQFDAQRTLVVSDNLWVARAAAAQAGLREVRVVSAPADSPLVSEVDSLRQFVAVDLLAPPRWPAARDTLWLDSGDELPLDLLDQPPPPQPGVKQRGGANKAPALGEQGDPPWGPWSRVRGFVAGPRATGVFPEESTPRVRVGLAATQGLVKEPGGMLEGQALGMQGQDLRVAHPLLGEVLLPLAELETVEFLGTTVRQRLEPAPHHLGNNRRPGWRVPLPEGSTWSLTYRRDANGPQAARVELTLVVHELLPRAVALPQNPPAVGTNTPSKAGALPNRQPAAGVAAGLVAGVGLPPLTTVVTLDDRPIGTLNELLTEAPLPGVRVPLRLALPASALSAGTHVLKFTQTPASNDPGEFDDFELEDLALEWQPR